jgi:DNA-directed RNA polymerase subunit RPC12/RpoP
MNEAKLGAHFDRAVTIDYCVPCQSFWFDEYESLALSPGSILALFHVIGEHTAPPSWRDGDTAKCPRCNSRLLKTHDMQRATRFEYLRCPHGHGRLTSFYSFLREKDFIRPLTPQQIAELRKNLRTISCSNCGAPVDLTQQAQCAHCGSPLTMLNLEQAESLIAQLREANQPQAIDPELPLKLARARREVEASFGALDRDTLWFQQVSSTGLVGTGLAALARWLNSRDS